MKLYDLKKAGGSVYDDYVTLLDENVTMLEKSGIFGEIGKNTQEAQGLNRLSASRRQNWQRAQQAG